MAVLPDVTWTLTNPLPWDNTGGLHSRPTRPGGGVLSGGAGHLPTECLWRLSGDSCTFSWFPWGKPR